MKRILFSCLTALGFLVGATESAQAFSAPVVSGHVCQAFTPTDASRLRYDSVYGPYNADTSNAASMSCPLTQDAAGYMGTMFVYYYNRNASKPVKCTTRILDWNGNTAWEQTQTAPEAKVEPQFFNFVPPANMNGVLVFQCTIGPKTAMGFSHITNLNVTNTN